MSHARQYEQISVERPTQTEHDIKNDPNYVSGLLGDGIILTCFGLT